jgi:hypothetical protein
MQATSMSVEGKCRPGDLPGRHHFDAAEMITRLYADDGAFAAGRLPPCGKHSPQLTVGDIGTDLTGVLRGDRLGGG